MTKTLIDQKAKICQSSKKIKKAVKNMKRVTLTFKIIILLRYKKH